VWENLIVNREDSHFIKKCRFGGGALALYQGTTFVGPHNKTLGP
jgi:hypothetical protein